MRLRLIALLIIMSGCRQAGSAHAATDTASDTIAARATVVRLEAEARALAHTNGCASADQCRMAPVGDRPCGGPRLYIPYCAATTDSIALFRKLDEVKAADHALNTLTNAMSTCQMRTPPLPGMVGGRCSAP